MTNKTGLAGHLLSTDMDATTRPDSVGQAHTPGIWRRVRGGAIAYCHSSGAFVEKVRADRYKAVRPDGEVVRVASNPDGSPYTPRAWHTGQDKPVVHYFPTAAAAKRAAIKGISA